MKEVQLKALAAELAEDLKTPEDLSAFSAQLTKMTIEAALQAEMTNHVGYEAHEVRGHHGEIELQTPRDREGSFEPPLIKKMKLASPAWTIKF